MPSRSPNPPHPDTTPASHGKLPAMTSPPEKRFDVGEAEEVFDNDVDGLPNMPPQDDIGWLRTKKRPSHEDKAPKAARRPQAGTRKPRKT